MCERARLNIFQAFKNINKTSNLKPLMIANSFFAVNFTKTARIKEIFSRLRINAHRIEEVTADLIAKHSESIKQGSFDRVAFEEALAKAILEEIFLFAPESIGAKDVLELVRSARVDGERPLGKWLADWTKSDDVSFVALSSEQEAARDRAVESIVSEPDLEAQTLQHRLANGVTPDTDPDLCG